MMPPRSPTSPARTRANKRRLAWERRVSINASNADDRLTAEGSFRISEREIQQLGYGPPRRMPVAANTLVVADTSGIHRRSTTTIQSARVSIWAYSRSNPFLPWTGGDITAPAGHQGVCLAAILEPDGPDEGRAQGPARLALGRPTHPPLAPP